MKNFRLGILFFYFYHVVIFLRKTRKMGKNLLKRINMQQFYQKKENIIAK